MKRLTWVLFSKRGFSNECLVRAFDTKEEAVEFVASHEHYAEIKTKKEALLENDFGYYIHNDETISLN